jgi:hypothetical protein
VRSARVACAAGRVCLLNCDHIFHKLLSRSCSVAPLAGPADVEAVLHKLMHTTSAEDVNVGASPTLADGALLLPWAVCTQP